MGFGVRASKVKGKDKSQFRQVRGTWYAPRDAGQLPYARIHPYSCTYCLHAARKRQSNSFGPVFDGSFGVDTEDLANTPGIDFNSLQFFPDQTSFGPLGPVDTHNITNVIQNGLDWIDLHADTANT